MRIYLDTNAFYFFFFQDEKSSPKVIEVLKQIHAGKHEGVTSVLSLDELAYVALLRLIEKKYEEHPVNVLRRSKAPILEFIPKIKDMFDVIFSFENLTITDATVSSIATVPMLMEEFRLLPRDALHLKTARETLCNAILSTDHDFDGIPGITRIGP